MQDTGLEQPWVQFSPNSNGCVTYDDTCWSQSNNAMVPHLERNYTTCTQKPPGEERRLHHQILMKLGWISHLAWLIMKWRRSSGRTLIASWPPKSMWLPGKYQSTPNAHFVTVGRTQYMHFFVPQSTIASDWTSNVSGQHQWGIRQYSASVHPLWNWYHPKRPNHLTLTVFNTSGYGHLMDIKKPCHGQRTTHPWHLWASDP